MSSRRTTRALAAVGLALTASLAACADSVGNGPASPGARRYGPADSVRLGLAARAAKGKHAGPQRDAQPADPTCDPSACGSFVSVSPGWFQGYAQPDPIEAYFTGPIMSVTVVGSGAITCSGSPGSIVGYDASGSEIGRVGMSLIDPADCSPPENPDNVTYGAQGTLVTTTPIARVEILPPDLLEFPVFDLTGHASAYYTLTYAAGQAKPELVVDCTPNPVERGQTVTCDGVLKNGPAYVLVERRAKGKGFTIAETPNTSLAAGEHFTWAGDAVAKTEVKFRVQYTDASGATKTPDKSVTFDVNARGWPVMQLTNAPQHTIAVYPPILLEYPTNGTLGFFWFEDPDPSNSSIVPVTSQATSGPNTGLWYFGAPIPMPTISYAYTHPGMYASATGGRAWYNDQNNKGSGTCTQAVLPSLASQAERHEGVTQATNSHYGVANRVYRDEALHLQFEKIYTSRSAGELIKEAGKVFKKFDSTYNSAQATFDSNDRPLIFGSLGCSLDFNPSDS